MDLFRVRLNCVDYYQATPTQFDPLLRNNIIPSQLHKEPKVPVIRVFGATETGQKVCAHIHGAFPYLYVEYTGSLVEDQVGAYIHRLHLSIDYALAVSYRRNAYDGSCRYVARITCVKGIPFYGYHVGYKYYLKIYMLNPMVMTRLADLLRQGVVMKRVFQPYEAHLQYLLQWMTDYNLYGCGYIDCREVTFRAPVPKYEDLNDLSHLWHDRSIPEELVIGNDELPRVSHCSIEIDICVQDIMNRKDIKPRSLHHDFIERLNPLAPHEKLVHSMAGLWRDETRRRRAKMSSADAGSSPFPAEVLVSMSADPRDSQPGGWIHEEEYREKLMDLIKEEKGKSDGRRISFESFVRPTSFQSGIKTCLESVEDLFPENLRTALGLEPGTNASYDIDESGDKEVDENRILGFKNADSNDILYDSDEEVMREIELSQRKRKDRIQDKDIGTIVKAEAETGSAMREDPLEDSHKTTGASASADSSLSEQPGNFPDTASADMQHNHPLDRLTDSGYASSSANKGYGGAEITSDKSERILKRSEPPSRSKDGHSKRQRISPGASDTSASRYPAPGVAFEVPTKTVNWPETEAGLVASTNCQSPEEHRPTQSATPKPQASILKRSSHEAVTFGGRSHSQFLKFPVVKDPHDPETIMRLSQKSNSEMGSQTQKKSIPFESTHSNSISSQEKRSILSSASSNSQEAPSTLRKVLKNMQTSFGSLRPNNFFAFSEVPPSTALVLATMQDYNLPHAIYQDAFYSNELDVPERPREWAGREFKLESKTVPFLPAFDPSGLSEASFGEKPSLLPDKAKEETLHTKRRRACGLQSWEIALPPPTYAEVDKWSQDEASEQTLDASKQRPQNQEPSRPKRKVKLSQIEGPTQKNAHGFKYTQSKEATSVQHEVQYMSTMSLEIHVNTRGNFVPNPEEDEIQCVFWCIQGEEGLSSNCKVDGTHLGIVALSMNGHITQNISRQASVEVVQEDNELDLLIRMVEIVRTHDPDILTGYEVHNGSWGFLIERARLKYEYNLCDEFSRMKSQSHGRFGKDSDKWGFNNTSTIRVTGRHMINIWRAMRSELNLLQYTMENVVFHILHRRIPHYTWADLTKWYTNGKMQDLAKVVNYYTSRVQLDLEILEANELIARTSEQARLLGVDFFSVFSRGSQFKVESLMFRIAKPEDFMLVSPSRKQVGGQNALECLPLVMEPQSAFYNSPLLVLDFQSLYPSVMIAYNYCYSTFLGRIVNWRGTSKMGFTEYKRQQRMLELLKDHINIAPNGIMYTKPEIRKSLLAKMLGEILETRVMVKSGMKVDKNDKPLQRLLNNRQLALKLIANVTYGYTSASFSGRMPCSEIADSIVQTGRETLERAIALIHSVKRWGAEVVYGDTDSLFVYLKGRTKDQAFDIGEEIAKTVTNMNPRPVKLKFEKVYFPCVLLAKKRYVGFKYEHRHQTEPDFDAKGIETVRRDGTPAEQKIEEKALKILFRSADLSQVKTYFQRQCEMIMKGSVSVQDFCFAREVKLGTYSDKGPPPPGALISTRKMLEDARAEPQYGERVPYVVITGAPGARLIDRCVAPEQLLEDDHSELDAEYYISKNLIPPLERIFNLVGANVRNWYDEMPKVQRIRKVDVNLQLQGQSRELAINKKTLESYMKSSSCLVCKEKLETDSPICSRCLSDKPTSLLSLRTRMNKEERKTLDLQRVCQSCSGISPVDEVTCDSKDCPVFYTRTRQTARLKMERAVVEPVIRDLSGGVVDLGDLEW